MRRLVTGGVVLSAALFVAGCSAEAVRRGTYDALYQKQCIDRTGSPNCEREYPDYDQYKRDREEVLKDR